MAADSPGALTGCLLFPNYIYSLCLHHHHHHFVLLFDFPLAETHAGDDRSDAGTDEDEIRRVKRHTHTPHAVTRYNLQKCF